MLILVDGTPVAAAPGQSVAAALMGAGIVHLRDSPRGAPRGAFCLVGACQECLVEVDGDRALACRTAARLGQVIRLGLRDA